MLSRTRPSRYLPALVLIGGLINATTSLVGNSKTLIAFRFPATIIEAVYFPGVIYLLSCWYKPQELGKRIAIFPTIAIVAQIVGNIASQNSSERHHILRSIGILRYVFFVDGILSILAASVAFAILPDYPAITRGLSRRERGLATIRLIRRGQDTGSNACCGIDRLSALEALFAAIRDPRVHVISIIAILTSAAGTASHMLLTSTIQTGYSSVCAHRFAIPVYLLSLVAVNVVSWTSDRTRDRRWHIHGALGLAMLGASVAALVSPHNPVKAALVTFFAAGIWSSIPLTLTWAAVAIRAPAEKRAIVLAIVHSVSGAACVFGVQMWPKMLGARQQVAAVMNTTFLVVALLVAFLIPAFVSLDNYRGTRAERDQALRRKDMEQVEDILDC
jgi:sugar phosphate permease